MTEIIFIEKRYEFPETWDECTDAQLLFLAKSYLANLHRFYMENEQGNKEPVSNEILEQLDYALFLGLINFDLRSIEEISEYDIEQMQDLIYGNNILHFIKNERNLYRNPFQKIKNLYGPADNFLDMEGEEFFAAQRQLYENMDAFIACLYRKKDSNGRELFSLQALNRNFPLIGKIPVEYKLLVRLYFESNVERLEQNNPEAFEGKDGGDSDFYEMLLNLAHEGTFGNYNEAIKANINLLFKEICRTVKEGKRLEEMYKNQK